MILIEILRKKGTEMVITSMMAINLKKFVFAEQPAMPARILEKPD